jgi:hypothetical protein
MKKGERSEKETEGFRSTKEKGLCPGREHYSPSYPRHSAPAMALVPIMSSKLALQTVQKEQALALP